MEKYTSSLKRELLRGVCFFIVDAQTYFNFSLACKYCASLAKEYAPLKKKEFSTVVIHTSTKYGKITCPVLPNGNVHGLVKFGDILLAFDAEIYANGNRVASILESFEPRHYSVSLQLNGFFCRVAGRLRVFETESTGLFGVTGIQRGKTIWAYKCLLCRHYHYFIAEAQMGTYLSFSWTCHTRKTVVKLEISNSALVFAWKRRRAIARSIVCYAKALQSEKHA